uniref:Uncharacterized protein n=1 Tax=Ciona savignyi TaxID=51511 RepID=H2YH81_CIOSA
MTHILKSINEASDIASMFKYICHVVIFDQQGISSKYLETFPCYLVSRLQVLTGYEVPGPVMVITMEFGKNYSGAGVDPFPIERTVFEASASHRSSSLHPVFYFYKQVFNDQSFFERPLDWNLPIPDRLLHLMEDFSLQYDLPSSHVLMLRRFMEETLGHDLRNWFAEDCLKISLTSSLLPFGCHGNNSSLITRSTELLTSSLPFKQEFLPFQIISES